MDTRSEPHDGTEAWSASLLRRVAEAADGYRNGRPMYFAVELAHPHQIVEVSMDEQTAHRAAGRANRGAPGAPTHRVLGPCVTLPDSTESPDEEVVSVSVTVKSRNGNLRTIAIDARENDALVWSLAAADKFIFPYYSLVSGVDTAARIRQDFIESGASVMVGPHKKYSLWKPLPDEFPDEDPIPTPPPPPGDSLEAALAGRPTITFAGESLVEQGATTAAAV
jgi:hypothetical protein